MHNITDSGGVVFLLCCLYCLSRPVNVNQMGQATWVIWAEIKTYSQIPYDVHEPQFLWSHFVIHFNTVIFISSADDVSSAELMVLLICPSSVVRCPSSVVRPSTFALNRYSSYSSYSIILNFLLEKLAI